MTVEELIKELSKYEDQSLEVRSRDGLVTGVSRFWQYGLDFVEIETS